MKRFKDILNEVEKPKEGIAKAMVAVGSAPGEALDHPVDTEAQFKGTEKKKERKADKDTGAGTKRGTDVAREIEGRNIPDGPAAQALKLMQMKRQSQRQSMYDESADVEGGPLKEDLDVLDETYKAGSMKLKDGSTVKLAKEEAAALNGLFKDLNSSNKKKMEERLQDSKASFTEIVNFAKEV